MRFDPPAIRRVKGATKQKERIKNKSKPLHKSARMIIPTPNPSKNFNTKILVRIMAQNDKHGRECPEKESESLPHRFS